ncbi:MAG: hypothetical protein LH609_00440 [Rudanella sp.]|nr:hypothetical protein [Rudanella sp.]
MLFNKSFVVPPAVLTALLITGGNDHSGYILINNHEYMQSVSRVYLNKFFKPVKGEYIVDYEGGRWRLCSASPTAPSPKAVRS